VLLDCPPQTLAHLYRLGADIPAAIDLILLSHEHADHIGGMDLLLLEETQGRSASARRGRPLGVGAPPGMYTRLREMIGDHARLPPIDDPRLAWLEGPAPGSFAHAGIEVERIEVEHAPEITSHGYRIRVGGGVLAYTGDTRMCDAVLELAEGADVLIVECGGARVAHHMEWDDVLGLREQVPQSTEILVTHYDHLPVPLRATSTPGLRLAEDFAVYEQ
jgi:ribonuclease BN (tRNA processing enzyme)